MILSRDEIAAKVQMFCEPHRDDEGLPFSVAASDVREFANTARALYAELDQLASCANILCNAVREGDQIAAHYGIQGSEFSIMRAAWLLDEGDEAERLHGLVGDHAPSKCPICVGEAAFTEEEF